MSRSEPTISALLPVHAGVGPDHLADALESLIAQTRRPDEIVVVEDGPLSDRHLQLLSELESRHDHVIRIRLAQNQGAGVANQAGLLAASGTWIAKVDSDDVNLSTRLEIQERIAVARSLDVCGAAMAEFEDDPGQVRRVRSTPRTHEQIARRMRVNNPINHPTAFFRRGKALEVGGYPPMRYMQDYDLFARMLAAGARMENLSDVLVLFRADSALITRRRANAVGSLERQLQRNLRSYGIVSRAQAARNLVVRSLFRRLPPVAMRAVYRLTYRRDVAAAASTRAAR